jgi:hypothetical protein
MYRNTIRCRRIEADNLNEIITKFEGGAAPLSATLANGNSANGLRITNLGATLDNADAATKSYVDTTAASISLGDVLASGNNANASKITNLGAPTIASDAATKQYVDSAAGASTTLSAVLANGNDAGAVKIANLGSPTVNSDAATKEYVDSAAGASVALSAVLANGNDAGAVKIANLAAPTLDGDAATKQYVDNAAGASVALSAVLANGNDAGAVKIANLGAPTANTDAATKAYVDSAATASSTLGNILSNGNDAGTTKIVNLGTPTLAADAATKQYVDTAAALPLSTVLGNGNDAGALKITNVGTPTVASDAATKSYVDSKSAATSTPAFYVYSDELFKVPNAEVLRFNRTLFANALFQNLTDRVEVVNSGLYELQYNCRSLGSPSLSPSNIGFVPMSFNAGSNNRGKISFYNDLMYISGRSGGTGQRMYIADISDPSSPNNLGSDSYAHGYEFAHFHEVVGNYMYLIQTDNDDTVDERIGIFDLSQSSANDPTDVLVGEWSHHPGEPASNYSWELANDGFQGRFDIYGDILITAVTRDTPSADCILYAVDISNKAAPVTITSLGGVTGSGIHWSSCLSSADGDIYIYMGDESVYKYDTGLSTFQFLYNWSVKLPLIEQGTPMAFERNLIAEDDYIYHLMATGGASYLVIINNEDKMNPALTTQLDISSQLSAQLDTRGVFKYNDFIFATDESRGLGSVTYYNVHDVLNPTHHEFTSAATFDTVSFLAVYKGVLYGSQIAVGATGEEGAFATRLNETYTANEYSVQVQQKPQAGIWGGIEDTGAVSAINNVSGSVICNANANDQFRILYNGSTTNIASGCSFSLKQIA